MKVLLYYLKQLLKFNLPFSFIIGSFAIALVPENWMKGFLTGALFSFFTGGFLLSVFFYHLRFENQYYYFYNKGFSILKLNLLAYLVCTPLLLLLLLFK
jgi:hypothetical protein